MPEGGEIPLTTGSTNNLEVIPEYWREIKNEYGSYYEFDFLKWRENLMSLPQGTSSLFYETVKPLLEDGDALEIIVGGCLASEIGGGRWDDLTGRTQTDVLAEKIDHILLVGKKALIESIGAGDHLSLSERQARIASLKKAAQVLRQIADRRKIDGSQFDLGEEDLVRFITVGRMGHGTIAENVASILESGLRVNSKRSSSKIPVASEAEENLRQFSLYDPLTYAKGENSVAVVYGSGVKLDDSPVMAIRDYETALEKGEIMRGINGQLVFAAQPELVICRTAEGKEIIMQSLLEDMRDKWQGRILTYNELVGESPVRLT